MTSPEFAGTGTRWTLSLETGVLVYEFPINPNAQESPFPNREVRWDYNPELGWAGTREGRTPKPWSFSGVLRDQEQYDDLLEWATQKKKLVLKDDRGDRFLVRLTTFAPTQVAGYRARLVPWRWTYTMSALIFDVLEPLP